MPGFLFFIMDAKTRKALIAYLQNFSAENRFLRFMQVLQNRTTHISIALEDIYQSQNASAVLRSADIFGVQHIHIIENKYPYQINPDVALGANKWLSLHYYNGQQQNTSFCIKNLRASGYAVVATTPHKEQYTVENLPLEKPIALFFGTELTGLSQTVLDNADMYVKIPMYGFTESFNISVSASIIMYELSKRLKKSNIPWHLSPEQQDVLLLQWLRTSIKDVENIEKRYFEMKKQSS